MNGPPPDQNSDDQTSPERLARALANHQLFLVYQPKVNLLSGQVEGLEALLRWRHPTLGELAPGRFLPAVNDSPLIVDIGNWVLSHALRQLARWQRQGLDLTISVNVAPRQLLREDFVATVRAALDEFPEVSPSRLELEILESAAIADTVRVREVVEACRAWGVKFSLDDFGTGYSSLSYLREIPTDTLKIDYAFVRDLLNDHEDLQLVNGIVSLARVFRRVVVAEGVETAEQAIVLMRLGCDLLQGFGIARPMPATLGGDLPA